MAATWLEAIRRRLVYSRPLTIVIANLISKARYKRVDKTLHREERKRKEREQGSTKYLYLFLGTDKKPEIN